MNSMRLRPLRTPKERARPMAAATEMGCTAEKVSVFGAKPVCPVSRATRPDLAFPSEGEAKESVRGRMFNSPRSDLSALCGLY